jgi:signal transduction histidine kinase
LQTRAISHENDSVETGENFDAYFRGLVTSYNSAACKIMLKDLSVIGLNTLDKEKQIVIYRVFNELFVNMKKHSNASSVVLSGKKTLNYLEMKYMDNGVGFEENAIIFKNGLKNMETRIKSINGTIKFENKSDKGIQVTIHFKK